MKWVNGLTWGAKKARKEEWHRWFAWHPIVIGFTGKGKDQRRVKIWLQMLWRKGEHWDSWGGDGWTWEYKESCPLPDERRRVVKEDTDAACASCITEEEKKAIITFAERLIERQEDLPPEYLKMIYERFWDLV